MPERHDHGLGRRPRARFQHRIAFAAELAAPAGVADAAFRKESLEQVVLVEKRQPQQRRERARERGLAATGQAGNDDEQ